MSSSIGCPLEVPVLPELKVLEVKILYNLTNVLRTELGTESYRSLVPEMFTIVIYLLISRELLCSKHFLAWDEMKALDSNIPREKSRPH